MLAVRVASTVRVGAPSPLRAAGAHMALFHDMAGSALPVKRGLYDPAAEKDSCGVGFVVDIKGLKTHSTVTQALQALENLDHRGAVGSDGLTGDGVGILTQVPHLFFRKKLRARGVDVAADSDIAVGVFFFPGAGATGAGTGAPGTPALMAIVDAALAEAGLERLMWRTVPIGTYSLGAGAARSLPDIRQLVVRRPAALMGGGAAGDDAFERLLYLVRKRLEKRLAPPPGASPLATTYIPSFSHRTVVYKGLVLAPNLRHLFPDLNDSDFQSAIALFHQRYATNTFPMWAGSQPFRMLAHNGEINTLQGNTKWMTMREETLSSPVWGSAIKDLVPVIQPTGSDSAMLDNVLELLVMSGRTPIQAVAMLVPEAYENDKAMDARTRAFFDYQRTLMEPWDGPAALCFTDGRTVAAALDRNGLRPLRYWLTSAGKLIAGSEVGIVDVPSERVLLRGKLGPGDMLAVDTERGVVMKNAEIKSGLASKRPYHAWLERSINHVGEGAQGLGQIMSYASLLKVLGPGEAAALLTSGDKAAAAAAAAADATAAAPPAPAPVPAAVRAGVEERVRLKKAFGYSKEDEELILKPMMDSAHEPIGSMGDDTPIAAFSAKPQLLYRYFKQRFAEVTNPPIDPLLERSVMSLNITFGRKGKLLQEDAGASFLLRLRSPVLTESQLNWLTAHELFANQRIDCTFAAADGPAGLRAGLERVCAAVEAAVDAGVSYMVLSDMGVGAARAPIPMLLAVGAVHSHLMAARKRMKASIICETGEAREDHHVAALISYGASLVYPRLAYETVVELAAERLRAGEPGAPTIERSLANYRTALQDGLLRIMSKMGISTVDSYRGSQTHEILGLDDALVAKYFAGSTARLSCVGLERLAADALAFHTAGYGEPVEFKRGTALPRSGAYATAKGGERHDWNPLVFNKLRAATQTDKFETYKKFATEVDSRPLTSLRDALEWVPAAGGPIPLSEVEPVEAIVKRFSTQAMSHGSIGREAHEALAIAANRLGSRSNTGEGGEDADRYQGAGGYAADRPDIGFSETWHPKAGDDGNSRIKQIASGRFGVTPNYLVHAEQLEIKMAQGSKPGEGGHIPGHKVNAEIAKNRYAQQGVTLISPPPMHDLYSIEDLGQLIYDLKRVNSTAQVGVKLVSQAGVGTIAAGVAKANADFIQISGNDGGTGASPLSSIKNAGLPWELGLAETQQVLVLNGLRGRVTLRVDGGLKTGTDVVKAALLGGEQFGFGTAALVALGCVMARKCHLNTCPVGIATQDPALRRKFKGRPEDVITFLIHTAEQVRQALAELGLRSLGEAVGRVDLLRPRTGATFPKGAMDMSALLTDADPAGTLPRAAADMRSRVDPDAGSALAGGSNWRNLDDIVWRTCADAVEAQRRPRAPGAPPQPPLTLHFPIRNCARSVGARLSGEIARRFGLAGLPDGAIGLHFHGIAGQSFGAFCNRGMKLVLRGEAHDYVGKSMYGGVIVLAPQAAPTLVAGEGSEEAAASAAPPHAAAAVAPPPAAAAESAPADTLASFVQPPRKENIICGNTVLYGATGGRFFAAGSAGERFAVRNSGATAVIEGLGDHGCEYMTNGTVVVLGATGRNFAAGMSGGEAFVLDVADAFLDAYNPGMVEALRVERGSPAEARLLALVREHVAETGSAYGRHVLAHWSEARDFFWRVVPNLTPAKANSQALLHVPSWSVRRRALATAGNEADTALPRLLSMQQYSTSAAAAAAAAAVAPGKPLA